MSQLSVNVLGEKIRNLRQDLGLSQESFCEPITNSEGKILILSERQLGRIERGEVASPGLEQLAFIANRLEISLPSLLSDDGDIPEKYRELKQRIIKIPSYREKSLADEKIKILKEIKAAYYDKLPEDEKLSIDILEEIFGIYLQKGILLKKKTLIDSYLNQLITKEIYNQNDLLLVWLFLTRQVRKPLKEHIFNHFITKVISQSKTSSLEEGTIILPICLSALYLLFSKSDYTLYPKLIEVANFTISKTKEFHRKPLILMVEGKFELFVNCDSRKATELYRRAIALAENLGEEFLAKKIEEEMKKDF